MAKNQGEEREDEHEDTAEPSVYEFGFHLNPELPTEEVKKEYRGIRSLSLLRGPLLPRANHTRFSSLTPFPAKRPRDDATLTPRISPGLCTKQQQRTMRR